MAQPVIELEETLYTPGKPDNGAGTMWCHGCTSLARVGDDVFATGVEVIPDVKPLNNVRWTLFQRGRDGWRLVHRDTEHRTREPSPLVAFADGRVLVSVNNALSPVNQYSGPAQPAVVQFDARDLSKPGKPLSPTWRNEPKFTEHSYRTFAGDPGTGDTLLMQNTSYDQCHVSLMNAKGEWTACPAITWPWAGDYPKPRHLRLCYPNVVLSNHALHFLGVSDIEEPNPAWHEFKKQATGREWDYDFRRLFYAYADDVTQTALSNWVEVASREATDGKTQQLDLHVDAAGVAHLLWREQSINPIMREKFFPNAELTVGLEYATVQDNQVTRRHTIDLWHENAAQPKPQISWARFHVTPDDRLFIIAAFTRNGAAENRLYELVDGQWSAPRALALQHPFAGPFMTATPRAGNARSHTLDLLTERSGAVGYTRLRLT